MSRSPRWRTAIPLMAALLAIALAGCGHQVSGVRGAPAAQTKSNGRPVDVNGTLTVAYSEDVARFDPRLTYDAYRRNVDLTLFDQLVTKDYYHPNKPLDVVPGLATSWKVSPNGRTYLFQLRRGVTFTDGTRFDADAAVFSLRTVIDPTFKYFCAACNAASKGDNSRIKDVRKLGAYRIAIDLKKPFGGFIELLSSQAQISAIVSPAAIKRYGNTDFNMHPVGTGYMKFVSYKPNIQAVFERNDRYWQGPVRYKRLVLRFITDPVARANALQSGEVNLADDVPPSYVNAWAGRLDVHPVEAPYPRQYGCQFNYRGGDPVAKRDVREALSLAADRNAMNQAIYRGRSRPAKGFFVEGVPAYDASMPDPAYDPARAKQLLARAGYAHGLKVRVEVGTTSEADPKILAIWQDSLRKIGVNLEVDTVDRPTWIKDWNTGLAPYPAGYDGMCWEYGSDLLWNLANYVGSWGYASKVTFNPGHYNNPKVESALEKAFTAKSLRSYYRALREANQRLMQDDGMVFTIGDLAVYGVAGNVTWTPARAIQSLWYDAVVHDR